MMRNIFLLFICFSVILFVFSSSYDVHLILENQMFGFSNIGEFWYAISPNTLQLIEAVVSRYIDPCSIFIFLGCSPFLWHPIISNILLLPATLSFITLCLILILIRYFYKKRRKRTFIRYE